MSSANLKLASYLNIEPLTIFTQYTLINEHVHLKKEGKIFACVIDFKKAFVRKAQ